MSSSHKIIAEPRTARIFMEDSPRRRLLLSFVERARTVSEVAAAEGLPIGRAHYLVSDFARRGLLRVEREEKRGGRAIKHYRSVASSFLVPLEFVSGSPGAGLAKEIRMRLDDELTRSEEDGILFFVDESGAPRVSWFGARPRRRPVAEFWQIVSLTNDEALELIRELEVLMERYGSRTRSGKPFLVHSAVVSRNPR